MSKLKVSHPKVGHKNYIIQILLKLNFLLLFSIIYNYYILFSIFNIHQIIHTKQKLVEHNHRDPPRINIT